MAKFDKPAEGSWTEHFPDLGTGPISYEDSISPEHYELERKAIFGRTWLNVGRVEQVPRPGSYFTKELDVADTSLIIVRGLDGQIRAFHNICRHRGNKLVWNDFPGEETQGTCRQFTCKYHGWRYGTDGACTFVQQESEFFDLDRADLGLVPVHVDVWEGFIFVNLDTGDADTVAGLPRFVRRRARGLPVRRDDPGAQVPGRRARQLEAVHRRVRRVLPRTRSALEAVHRRRSPQAVGYGYEGLHYDIDGPHGMQSTWGGMAPPKDPNMVKPIERVLRSGNFGAWDRPDIPGLDPLPAGVNPSGTVVGSRLVRVLPELHDRHLGAGLVPHVPLLADRLQPAHLRRHALLRAAGRRPRPPAPGARRGHVQGVRPPGLQHPRGHPADARIPCGHRVPAQRPGDPAAPPPQDGRRLRRRIPADEPRPAGRVAVAG